MINNQKLFEMTEKLYEEHKNTQELPNSEYGCKEIFAGFHVVIPNGKYIIRITHIDWETDRKDKKMFNLGFRESFHLNIYRKSEIQKRPDYPRRTKLLLISRDETKYTNSFDCRNRTEVKESRKWFSLIMQMFFEYDRTFFN